MKLFLQRHSTERFRGKLVIAIASASLVFFGAGCSASSTPSTGPDAGVWKSTDGGLTWVQKKAYVAGAKVTSAIANIAVSALEFDPQDHATLYLGSSDSGLLFTRDAGESWRQEKNADPVKSAVTSGNIRSVAVHPKNRCTVYAASGNKIYKTETCAVEWTQVYSDPRTDNSFTRLSLDWYNPNNLYAGTTDGDVLKSENGGLSWKKLNRVAGVPISQIIVDRTDSRVIYVGTQGEGLLKSVDSGVTWESIKAQFGNELKDLRRVTELVQDPVDAKTLYIVSSKYGVGKSEDGGETWKGLNLTTPPGSVKLYTMAIDPKNNKKLFLAGVKTFQISSDGGNTWTVKKLPTTQAGGVLRIDPMDSNSIYLGTVPPPQTQ